MEELGRVVDSDRPALAGHTERLFDEHVSRKEILGIPEGKSAYRDAVALGPLERLRSAGLACGQRDIAA